MRTDAYLIGKDSKPPISISASGKFVKFGVQSAFAILVRSLMTFLVGSSEPRIWQRRDRHGISWHVYDPVTQQRIQFPSEQEVRIWLEQRYSSTLKLDP